MDSLEKLREDFEAYKKSKEPSGSDSASGCLIAIFIYFFLLPTYMILIAESPGIQKLIIEAADFIKHLTGTG